jgi:hypothetical protein
MCAAATGTTTMITVMTITMTDREPLPLTLTLSPLAGRGSAILPSPRLRGEEGPHRASDGRVRGGQPLGSA